MRRAYIVLISLLLAVVLVSGCSGISNTAFCTPNYVKSYSGNFLMPVNADDCKRSCYNAYETTSFKVEGDTCYCDVNKCG